MYMFRLPSAITTSTMKITNSQRVSIRWQNFQLFVLSETVACLVPVSSENKCGWRWIARLCTFSNVIKKEFLECNWNRIHWKQHSTVTWFIQRDPSFCKQKLQEAGHLKLVWNNLNSLCQHNLKICLKWGVLENKHQLNYFLITFSAITRVFRNLKNYHFMKLKPSFN